MPDSPVAQPDAQPAATAARRKESTLV